MFTPSSVQPNPDPQGPSAGGVRMGAPLQWGPARDAGGQGARGWQKHRFLPSTEGKHTRLHRRDSIYAEKAKPRGREQTTGSESGSGEVTDRKEGGLKGLSERQKDSAS